MKKIYSLSVSIIFSIIITGCSNAVSYHHSERNSIALEFRTTEPQQPLQGNIGVKTRTALVTPGLNNIADQTNTKKSGPGESLSVISDFSFKREKVDGFSFGKTTIKSAFITGIPAKEMQSIQTTKNVSSNSVTESLSVFEALSGAVPETITK